MLKGTIIKGIGGFYYISTENGVYECRARGKFRKEGIKPTVGDIVNISVLDEKNKKGSLDVTALYVRERRISTRLSLFLRRSARILTRTLWTDLLSLPNSRSLT